VRSTSRLAAALLLSGVVVSGCATFSERKEAAPHVVVAEDGGEEEVLPVDGDERDTSDFSHGDEDKAGNLFMAITTVVMTVASAVLPYLLLL